MKKLLTVAALSFALAGFAEDQYLYWMVSDNATLDGQSLTSLGETYYAKIKGNDGGDYLYLYDTIGGSSTPFGQALEFEAGDSGRVFAYIGSSQVASFLVELYNSNAADANPIGYADVDWAAISAYITKPGMGQPSTGAYGVGDFSSVPEPTSGMLLLLGVAGLALRRKNKKA